MLCVMWLPNERTFYSFPSSLKCFTFLLVWKREKPCHPSTCVLCSCDWIENLLSKNAVWFSWRASYPETHEALQCSFPLEDHPNSILFLSYTLSCLFIGLFPPKRERLSVRPFASVFVAKATILSQQKRRERKKIHFNTQCEPQSIC